MDESILSIYKVTIILISRYLSKVILLLIIYSKGLLVNRKNQIILHRGNEKVLHQVLAKDNPVDYDYNKGKYGKIEINTF